MLNKFGKKIALAVLATGVSLGAFDAHSAAMAANLPSMKRGIAELVGTGSAGYSTLTDHTYLNQSDVVPEIKALARALKHDPDLIYAYVKNKVEITPMFGLQKGALGAYIDGHGTAFDQAQLMLHLAKASIGQTGSTITDAKFVYGTVTLSPAQLKSWLGVDSQSAVCRLLANGGIPADIAGVTNGSTCANLSKTAGSSGNVTLAHAWVILSVTGSGDVTYDPAFKDHLHHDGVGLAALMTSDQDAETASGIATVTGGSGAVDEGISYAHGVNPTGVETSLNQKSASLLSSLKTAHKEKTVIELVGGSEILDAAYPVAAPSYTLTPIISNAADVPDQFRTTLTIDYDDVYAETNSVPVTITIFADEVYGRKLELIPDMSGVHFGFPQAEERVPTQTELDNAAATGEAYANSNWDTLQATCDELRNDPEGPQLPYSCSLATLQDYIDYRIAVEQDGLYFETSVPFTVKLVSDGKQELVGAAPEQVEGADDTNISYSGTNLANGRSGWDIALSVNHPYAASSGTYMDQTVATSFDIVTNVSIVNGWGYTSGELMEKWAREYGQDTVYKARLTPYTRGGKCNDTGCDPSDLSIQENTKAKVGANWLAQFSRAANLATAMQDAQVQHHHTIGLSYAETTISEDCEWNHDINACRYSTEDQVLRLDLSTAVSIIDENATDEATAKENENALFQVVAAAGSTLEGSVFEQMIDAVDTASTAERFQWAEEAFRAVDQIITTQPKFYELTDAYFDDIRADAISGDGDFEVQKKLRSLILTEGIDRVSPTSPDDDCTNTRFNGKEYLCYVTQGYLHIKEYLDAGYDVVSVNDEFLGPGYEFGLKKVFATTTSGDYTFTFHEKTRQRGAAFIAVKKDANGNILELAHVVSGLEDKYKGGGAATPEDAEDAFDPAKAADILKDEFEDKSVVHGVDLASGNASWSSGPILSVGNGGFPFELSLEMKIANNQEVPPNPAQQHWRYGIFEDNLKAEATMSGSGLEGMGKSHPWNAVGSLVAFQAAFEAAKDGDLNGQVLLPFINHWWRAQLTHNVVTLSGSAGGTQFVKLPDGSFNAPAGVPGNLELTCTDGTEGTCGPVAVRDYQSSRGPTSQFSLHRRWTYDSITYVATLGDQTTLTFAPTMHFASDSERSKQVYKHYITNRTTQNGFEVTYAYHDGTRSRGVRMASVSNEFGKTLTFTYGGDLDVTPDSISNGTYAVTFGGAGLTTPENETYTFETVTTSDLPTGARQRPGFQLKTINLPEVGASLRYSYDEELRVATVEDAYAIRGSREPYEFFIAPGFRSERVDPANNNYVAWYGLRDNSKHTLSSYRTLNADGTQTSAITKEIDVKSYGLFVDEMDREVRTDFDAWGRVIARTYPGGRKQVFTYDNHSNVLTSWMYPTTVAQQAGQPPMKALAAYDTSINKPVQIRSPRGSGHVSALSYDANGNLIQVDRPKDLNGDTPTFHYGYNEHGQLTRTVDAACMVTSNVYFGATDGSDHGYLQSTIVDDGLTELVGSCSATVDSEGNDLEGESHLRITSTFEYNSVGDRTAIIDPRGNKTVTQYDHMRRAEVVTDPLNNYAEIKYSSLGQEKWKKQFDAAGNFLMGTAKDYTLTGQVEYHYSPRCFESDGGLSKSRSDCTFTEYRYTPLDQIDIMIDAEGRRTNTNYAPDGQVTEVFRAWQSPTDQILYQEFFYDDSTGLKTGVEDANGNRTSYVYDGYHRLETTIFPVKGTVGSGSSATNVDYETYEYDLENNMVQKRTRAGDYIVNSYDKLNRLVSKQVHHGSLAEADIENTVYYNYDLMGRDVCLAQTGGTTADGHDIPTHALYYAYDSAGRQAHERQGATSTSVNGRLTCGDAGGFKVRVGRDAAGNRTSLWLPGGGATNLGAKLTYFSYDKLNRMDKIRNGAQTAIYADYSYDALSRKQGVTFENTQSVTLTYFNFAQDGSGYVEATPKALSHTFTAGQDITYSFGYNLVNQITSRTLSNPAYMFRSFEDNPTKDYLVNGLNQYTDITTKSEEGVETDYKAPLYTDNGSLDTYGDWDYDYDAENRLVYAENSVTKVKATYGYDPKGRRIVKKVQEDTASAVYTHFLYEGDEPITDLMGASATASDNPIVARYLHGADVDERLVYWSHDQLSGEVSAQFYYHADHQGSIVALSNGLATYTDSNGDPVALGAQVALYNYDAYGNLKKGAGDDQPFLYTGRRYDAETGLYYYRARYYSAELGRFLQTDPVGYEDNMNMYGYVGNDPVNNTDPSGKFLNFIVKFAVDVAVEAAIQYATTGEVDLAEAATEAAIGMINPAKTVRRVEKLASLMRSGDKARDAAKNADRAKDTKKATEGATDAKTGTCCFVAGTPVLTEEGLKNIEDIKVGDLVWSRNPETGEQELKPVTDFIPRHDRVIWELTVQNAAGETETFETTEEHPWWVDGKGWKRTDELAFGMRVEDEDQNVIVVVSVRQTDRTDGTFNLTIADFHTYFVGNLNVLVHNCDTTTPKDTEQYGSRRAAMRAAKRDANIPTSQTHNTHRSNVQADAMDSRRSATEYEFDGGKSVQDHPDGHTFADGTKYPKAHFNNHGPNGTKRHYEYEKKKK